MLAVVSTGLQISMIRNQTDNLVYAIPVFVGSDWFSSQSSSILRVIKVDHFLQAVAHTKPAVAAGGEGGGAEFEVVK